MNTQAKVLIGILAAVVVGLGAALSIVLATGDDGDGSSMPRAMNQDDSFMGMMEAMGSMDSDTMLTHMRDVLGEDGYQRMMNHMQDHRSGGPMTGNVDVDDMMHQMMDGMMQRMPMDSGGMMPGTPAMQRQTPTPSQQDLHHETPTPGTAQR